MCKSQCSNSSLTSPEHSTIALCRRKLAIHSVSSIWCRWLYPRLDWQAPANNHNESSDSVKSPSNFKERYGASSSTLLVNVELKRTETVIKYGLYIAWMNRLVFLYFATQRDTSHNNGRMRNECMYKNRRRQWKTTHREREKKVPLKFGIAAKCRA